MHLICLHNVVEGPVDAFDAKCSRITVGELAWFLDAVARDFDLVSYATYAARLAEGRGLDGTVALSFDDGFKGVIKHALPVLASRGLDAIAFINPPFLGNPDGALFHFLELEIAFRLTTAPALSFDGEAFDLGAERARVKAMKRVKKLLKTRPEADRAVGHKEVLEGLGVERSKILDFARGEDRFQIMDADDIRALRNRGWTIGSHAMSHRTLSMLSPAELAAEIDEAAEAFEDHFAWSGLPFAYPYGDAIHVGDAAPAAVALRGHPMAFTTQPGPSDLAGNPHRLPRIDYKRFLREKGLQPAA